MTLKYQAEQVARAARRAASESRELLADLRRASSVDAIVDIAAELSARAADFTRRTGVPAEYRPLPGSRLPRVPPAVARQLLTIAAEAMENAHRHAAAHRVEVTGGIVRDQLCLSVLDDGRGLPPGTTLDALKQTGHFGLVGMVERAASIGARIRIGRGHRTTGTEVRVDLPLAALPPAEGTGPAEPVEPAGAPAPAALPRRQPRHATSLFRESRETARPPGSSGTPATDPARSGAPPPETQEAQAQEPRTQDAGTQAPQQAPRLPDGPTLSLNAPAPPPESPRSRAGAHSPSSFQPWKARTPAPIPRPPGSSETGEPAPRDTPPDPHRTP
jgi:two-component sensor histidine kinase